MKIFRSNKKAKKNRFRITEADRSWVEDNFKWLIQVYGYPKRQHQQIVVSEQFFPGAFAARSVNIQALIEDLCQLFDIESSKIFYDMHADIRDSYRTPYIMEGTSFEAETEVLDNGYKIHLAKSITTRPNRLIFSLIYEFINIRLTEDQLQYDTGQDSSLFIFIAGIYFGFGLPLAQQLTDRGRVNDGLWETKWTYVSEMPHELMAYGLAMYVKLLEQESPAWTDELPKELQTQFEGAVAFLNESSSFIDYKTELKASDLFFQANQAYQNKNFDLAISTLQQILPIVDNESLKADVYNNLGYYQLRKSAYEQSILHFQEALRRQPDMGFAHDNLGYALIQLGQLEAGKQQLDQALRTDNNDNAYTYRNLALYHLGKNEIDEARKNFQLAFESQTVPVDLLEFHYADFLLDQGDTDKGMAYLQKAVEKGEPEAIQRMRDINGS